MAGNYPDAPSWRMAIDRDGTQLVHVAENNTISVGSTTDLRSLNDEFDAGILSDYNGYTVLIFPELRDIDGLFIHWQSGQFGPALNGGVQVSTNTTNGLDGTWTSIGATPVNAAANPTKPAYRTQISSTTALAVRAVRVKWGNSSYGSSYFSNLLSFHVYGEPAPGQNPNRLELWHPTLDEKLPPAYLDWGDVPRSSSADKTFRVKNLSSQQSANSIRVAMEILTDSGAPSVVAQHTLSYAGGSYVPQVNIGSLAPGAISGVVTLRRVTPSNAVLSLWSFRVFAESTDWQ
jgi:hypothetical protein